MRLGLEISPEVAHQIREGWPEKVAIARSAAALVEKGDHLIFDSGILSYITACCLPGNLLIQGALTVITNSLLVALELAPWPGVETILLGGEYQADGLMDLTGPSAIHTLEGLHADKMFLTVNTGGSSHASSTLREEADLEKSMVAASTKVILLTTRDAHGQIDRIASLPISATCTLVTSQGAPAEFVSHLRNRGAQIVLVKTGSKKA